jgi:peroxiredoxin
LAGYEFWKNQLAAAGVRVVAASVDPIDKAREVAGVVSFPVGFGATREIGEQLGAWWEAKRGYIQPAEFIVSPEGKVLASSYSAGPLGRMDAAEVVRMANFLDAQKK